MDPFTWSALWRAIALIFAILFGTGAGKAALVDAVLCPLECQSPGASNQSACNPVEAQLRLQWEPTLNRVTIENENDTSGGGPYGVAITRLDAHTAVAGTTTVWSGWLGIGQSATVFLPVPYHGVGSIDWVLTVAGNGGPQYSTLYAGTCDGCGMETPEPADWGLCLAGVLMIGYGHRHRRNHREP